MQALFDTLDSYPLLDILFVSAAVAIGASLIAVELFRAHRRHQAEGKQQTFTDEHATRERLGYPIRRGDRS